MSTKRMTSKDYKKEYEETVLSLSVLEKRIQMRFLTLCKRHPDVELYKINDKGLNDKSVLSGDFVNAYRPVARLDIEAMIKFIGIIEAFNASKHPHKQTTIEFNNDSAIETTIRIRPAVSIEDRHNYEICSNCIKLKECTTTPDEFEFCNKYEG